MTQVSEKELQLMQAMSTVVDEQEAYMNRKISARRREAKAARTLAEKIRLQREVRALEMLRSNLRMSRFDLEDKMLEWAS